MDTISSETPLRAASTISLRFLYIRNYASEAITVEILAPSKGDYKVLASIDVGSGAVAHWRGKSASSIDVRVLGNRRMATRTIEVPDPLAPFELFVLENQVGKLDLTTREGDVLIGGRVSTVERLTETGDLAAESPYVSGGFQVVRDGASYVVAAPDMILCPDDLRPSMEETFAQLFSEAKRQIPTFTVGAIRNGRVLTSRYMSVFTESNKMVKEQQNLTLMMRDPGYRSVVESRDLLRIRILAPSMVKGKARRVDFPAFVLGNGMAWNYGHWLMDLLPRLLALEKVERSTELKILLPRRDIVLDLWKDVFELFDIDPKRAVFFDEIAEGADLLQFPELICPGFQHVEHWEGGIAPSPALVEIYSKLRSRLDVREPYRRVYVSRREANTRRMANEEELCRMLSSKGFEIIVGEDLTLRGKLRLFSETKVIAGLMGSNLANCTMMPPGGLVLEFFGNEYMLDALRPVANVCGHQYVAVVGASVGDLPRRRKNIEAPVELLGRELDRLVS